jgi:hypothetical protein
MQSSAASTLLGPNILHSTVLKHPQEHFKENFWFREHIVSPKMFAKVHYHDIRYTSRARDLVFSDEFAVVNAPGVTVDSLVN